MATKVKRTVKTLKTIVKKLDEDAKKKVKKAPAKKPAKKKSVAAEALRIKAELAKNPQSEPKAKSIKDVDDPVRDEWRPLSYNEIMKIKGLNKKAPCLIKLPFSVRLGVWPSGENQIATHIGICELAPGQFRTVYFQQVDETGKMIVIERIYNNPNLVDGNGNKVGVKEKPELAS